MWPLLCAGCAGAAVRAPTARCLPRPSVQRPQKPDTAQLLGDDGDDGDDDDDDDGGRLTQLTTTVKMVRIMRVKAIVAISVSLIVSASAGAEIKDLGSYGICAVFTDIDEFSDITTHAFICGSKVKINEDDLSDVNERIDNISGELIAILCQESEQVLLFSIPYMLFGDSGDVRYRFDKGEVYEESWTFREEGSGETYTEDPEVISNFLHKMSGVESTFVFDFRGEIYKLDFSETDVSTATSDYVDRCSA